MKDDHLAYYREMFSYFDFALVVEDEVEHFRDWNHNQFNYPYEKRMVVLSAMDLDLDYSMFNDALEGDPNWYKYSYELRELIF